MLKICQVRTDRLRNDQVEISKSSLHHSDYLATELPCQVRTKFGLKLFFLVKNNFVVQHLRNVAQYNILYSYALLYDIIFFREKFALCRHHIIFCTVMHCSMILSLKNIFKSTIALSLPFCFPLTVINYEFCE